MSKKLPMKSAVFEHFTVTQDEKYCVCQCMTSDSEENKCCDAKISAYSGSDKNAPTRASNLKRHLQRFHTEVFKAGNLIGKVRKFVIAARTPKIDSILKRRAGKGAIVDQATRWGSTYLMIERLLELKPFLIDMANPQVTLNEGQWTQVAELKELLNHPFTVTKKLQAEDLTPGIFIREWKNLLFCLSQRGGLIADGNSASMKRRETQLLENKMFLAAVYVDPSHRILLDDQQLTKGKEALTEVAVRMSGLQEDCQAQEDLGPDSATAAISSSSSDEEFDFDKYLDDMKQAKHCRKEKDFTPSPIASRLTILHQNVSLALKEIEKFNRSSKLTVHEAIPLYPDIVRDVAHVVTALPPTQVSVERSRKRHSCDRPPIKAQYEGHTSILLQKAG
ncbi:uncharacterized protein [Phyllobates terribilis]|uniref:uncharacterized protein n=1 Tax=Phyllobates terribilis TaxID=111132 RepID=UPI003CCB4742